MKAITKRIPMDELQVISCVMRAHTSGMKAAKVGEASDGLTRQQVYRICKASGFSITDIRNGKSPVSRKIVTKYCVKALEASPATVKEIIGQIPKALME
jgi:hypothetical protein